MLKWQYEGFVLSMIQIDGKSKGHACRKNLRAHPGPGSQDSYFYYYYLYLKYLCGSGNESNVILIYP